MMAINQAALVYAQCFSFSIILPLDAMNRPEILKDRGVNAYRIRKGTCQNLLTKCFINY